MNLWALELVPLYLHLHLPDPGPHLSFGCQKERPKLPSNSVSLPLASSQHSSQRELSGSTILVRIAHSQLLHSSEEKDENPSWDLQGLTCWSPPNSAAVPSATFPLTFAPCIFLKLFCFGCFLFPLPPCLSIFQIKHHWGHHLETPLPSLKFGWFHPVTVFPAFRTSFCGFFVHIYLCNYLMHVYLPD